MFKNIRLKNCIMIVLGTAILAFGFYQIHSHADVTEGGLLGTTLLLEHWFSISPAVSGAVLNAVCYLFGWRVLGKDFLLYSLLGAAAFSASYAFFERFPLLWPELYTYPLLAALLGAAFVGVGVGIAVRMGAAPGGDDALAMTISHLTGMRLEMVYLIFDLIVLGASLCYIPWKRLFFSLLTVVLSGQIIGLVQRIPFRRKKNDHFPFKKE